MAKHVVITDDITGEQGAEMCVIVVNGKGIEIDLAPKSMERLTRALLPFWEVGSEGDYQVTRQLGRKRAPAPASSQSPSAAQKNGVDNKSLRAWAADNGIEVPPRGRIPGAIVEQYVAANGAAR